MPQNKIGSMIIRDVDSEHVGAFLSAMTDNDPKENPGKPEETPEVEPEKLPKENPGISPDQPDEDENEPWDEPEVGDDPDEIKTKTTIMVHRK